MNKNIGLATFRSDIEKFAKSVSRGNSFVVTKHSHPLFKIVAIEDEGKEQWETIIDFTKFSKDGRGIPAKDLARRLRAMR